MVHLQFKRMKKAKFLCPGTYDPDLDKGEANDGSSITIEDELTDLNEILGRMVAGQNDLLFRHPDLEGEDDDDMDGIPHQRFTESSPLFSHSFCHSAKSF